MPLVLIAIIFSVTVPKQESNLFLLSKPNGKKNQESIIVKHDKLVNN